MAPPGSRGPGRAGRSPQGRATDRTQQEPRLCPQDPAGPKAATCQGSRRARNRGIRSRRSDSSRTRRASRSAVGAGPLVLLPGRMPGFPCLGTSRAGIVQGGLGGGEPILSGVIRGLGLLGGGLGFGQGALGRRLRRSSASWRMASRRSRARPAFVSRTALRSPGTELATRAQCRGSSELVREGARWYRCSRCRWCRRSRRSRRQAAWLAP
jgi:hypothetical protein